MFFDMFTKEKIEYVEDNYKILDNTSIDAYNNKEIENRMKQLISNVQEMECKYLEFLVPSMTPNYELKEEMLILNLNLFLIIYFVIMKKLFL